MPTLQSVLFPIHLSTCNNIAAARECAIVRYVTKTEERTTVSQQSSLVVTHVSLLFDVLPN